MSQFTKLLEDAVAGFARWLDMDPDAMSEQLHVYVIEGADPTQLDWQHFLARIAEGDLDHFTVGERAPAGVLTCKACGEHLKLPAPRLLEPCLNCSSSEYDYRGPRLEE